MEVYFGGAEEQEITEEEIAAVRAMVMAVQAGRIYVQSKEVLEKMQQTDYGREKAESDCAPGCC